MESLRQAKKVRLRHQHGKYLVAKDDESSVKLGKNGSLERAKWTVEFVTGSNSIRLKSYYNKYLTICDEHVAPGTKGRKVRQTSLSSDDSLVKWQPIKDGEHIKLKSQQGFLRGYRGWYRPWKNAIGHYESDGTQRSDWQWNVEIAEPLERHKDTTTHEQPPPQATQVPTRCQTTTKGKEDSRRKKQLPGVGEAGVVVGAAGVAVSAAGVGVRAAELGNGDAGKEEEAGEEDDLVVAEDVVDGDGGWEY